MLGLRDWLHAALRANMQCNFFHPFGHKILFGLCFVVWNGSILGRPNDTTAPEMINKIHDTVLNDLKLKVREIAEVVFISTECVINILHTHLCMSKLCARWVPRLLTIDQKRIRVTTSKKNLAHFNRNPKDFLRRFVTMDEA